MNKKLINLKIESLSTPPDVKNKIAFTSSYPFVLDMNKSTLRDTLGFNLSQNVDSGFFTKITDPNITKDKNKFRYLTNFSFLNQTRSNLFCLYSNFIKCRIPSLPAPLIFQSRS